MAQLRGVRFLLLAAIGLIFLGSANLLYGVNRISRYEGALSRLVVAANKDSDILQGGALAKVKARLEFYQLVCVGGRSMLAVAAIILFGLLMYFKKSLTWSILSIPVERS